MIEVPSTPPVVTFGDLLAGDAYQAGNGQAYLKTTAGAAVHLVSGADAAPAAGEVVTPAPDAVFELFV